MSATSVQLADDFLQRFAAALRSAQLYSPGHHLIARNADELWSALQSLHGVQPAITIRLAGDDVAVDDASGQTSGLGALVRRLQQSHVECITVERGVTREEITAGMTALITLEPLAPGATDTFPRLPHLRIGRAADNRGGHLTDMATVSRLYADAVSLAGDVWDSARTEGRPDATAARLMIDGLAQTVTQNRSALLALTTMKTYDNYTFTHMVNVAILTMGQARSLGIDGAQLREFGLAALMHDIGKVRTPLEVLNKPDTLTDAEFTIMRRHVVDGAEILRMTPDIPPLVPVVAFEHHLRIDGSGYPFGVTRPALNLGTMLCSIADVYDAMRSQRHYQKAFSSDRIFSVLVRNGGTQFDQHLVRRFVRLVGIADPDARPAAPG